MSESKHSSHGETYQKLRGLERQDLALKQAEKLLKNLKNERGEQIVDGIEALLARVHHVTGGEKPKNDASDRTQTQNIEEEMALIQEQINPEQVASEEKRAFKTLRRFMARRGELTGLKRELGEKTTELIRSVYSNHQLRDDASVWGVISSFEEARSQIEGQIFELAKQSPVAFQAYWLLKIRDWKDSFETHGIIETNAIEEQTQRVMDDARRKLEGTNGVVTLLGPTGSGKTVLAKKLASKFSADGEFEFVSAHPKMTAFDLVQRMGIVIEQLDPSEIPGKIKEAQAKFQAENPDLLDAELQLALKTIKDVVEGRAKEKTFETKPILEAVGRARKEGRKVVIDEFNYLPAETLASLNDILSSKDNPPGFGVIFTGNIGEEYLKRQGLDPAFINRVLSGTIKYEFPPQEINRKLGDAIEDNTQLAGETEPPMRDLFQIAITQLVDKKGNLLAPEGALEQVWDFVRICSLAQQLAQGKDFRSLGLEAPAGSSAFQFKSILLSFRNINQVVREWKLGGFKQPLEWHIHDAIIRPAAVFAPKEAAELMYLFTNWGGMFQQPEWSHVDVDSTQWRMAGIETVKQPKPKNQLLKAFQPAELVEAVSGFRLPAEQLTEEDAVEAEHGQEFERLIAEVEQQIREMEAEFNRPEYVVIERLCETRFTEGLEKKSETLGVSGS